MEEIRKFISKRYYLSRDFKNYLENMSFKEKVFLVEEIVSVLRWEK